MLLSSSELTIEDTWTVLGMCGTGSHHVTANDVFVPVARTCPTLVDEPCVDVPLVHIPFPTYVRTRDRRHGLGCGARALDDILAIAGGKTPLLAGAPLAANTLFQYELGQADTDLPARVLAYQEAGSAWAVAADRAGFTMQRRAWIRATAVWVTARAMAVVDFAYHAGGGSALYATNALQRRLRDIHAITQHFLVKPDTLTTVGAALAGQEVGLPVF